MPARIGVLTISDRVSAGTMEDRGGPAVEAALAPLTASVRDVVPDDRTRIEWKLREWADDQRLDVILTTGGTGLGPRDITPEATIAVCDRLVPGIAEAMRAAGLRKLPQAMLSRGVAGIRGTTLIVNLPGSPKGAAEGVEVIAPILEHAVATLGGASHGSQ